MFLASCFQNVCFHLVSSSCDKCVYCDHLRMGGTPCGDGVNMAEDSLIIQFVPQVRIAHKTPSLESPEPIHLEAVSFPPTSSHSLSGKRKLQKTLSKYWNVLIMMISWCDSIKKQSFRDSWCTALVFISLNDDEDHLRLMKTHHSANQKIRIHI